MRAEIIGKDERGLGVKVVDNDGTVHTVAIGFNGEVQGHSQDGYPNDPSERDTNEAEIAGSQARRYAKYHVDKETDYETLPWNLNHERLETVRETLATLSAEEIEEYFGDLLRQSLSHYADDPAVDTGDVSRPVKLPTDMSAHENALTYEQEIYLDETDEIESVSGIIIDYFAGEGNRKEARHGDAPNHNPDAKVELSPVPIVAPEPFRDYLCYNLRCQIRDCFIVTGREPPEEYKVLGPGQYEFTREYHLWDKYPEYHDKWSDIPGYSYEFEPSSPVPMEELRGAMADGDAGSLYDRVRDTLFTRRS